MKSLVSYLQQVPDYRRAQGKRVPMATFLSMVVLGYMSRRFSMQSLARFMKSNEAFFSDLFGLQHGVPGYTQIRTLLQSIDFKELNKAFHDWASQYIDEEAEDWISIDGKALDSTKSNSQDSHQDFQDMVSAFSRSKDILLTSRQFTNNKESEIHTAQELIKDLEGKGMVLNLDALHCQIRPRPLSWLEEMTI